MYFNSINFILFIGLFFLLYWFVFNKSIKLQNSLIIGGSYLFYGRWDWRFLILIIISSAIDFAVGNKIHTSKGKKKKTFLILSLMSNLGLLFFFKYFNFFIEGFSDSLLILGLNVNLSTLSIILPVGISFYTFQTLSYSIDIYREKIKPEKDVFAFFSFVSFFPQLVAGPIERAADLLPQFGKKRSFDYALATDGMRQFLWGLFKKVVIADNCAYLLNPIFENYAVESSSSLLLATFLFSIQIYCDFSGYSDMAIGISKLFGFRLKLNFKVPYFSRNIGEFWKRWHISLSSWFRDYLYIPLGGSHHGRQKTIRNLTIVFLVSALWHGANWTFICWGILHAFYFLLLFILGINKTYKGEIGSESILKRVKTLFSIITTFSLVSFAWIFFRSETVADAFGFIKGIFTQPFFSKSELNMEVKITLFLIIAMLLIEWFQRNEDHPLKKLANRTPLIRWSLYLTIGFVIYLLKGDPQTFIYFQF